MNHLAELIDRELFERPAELPVPEIYHPKALRIAEQIERAYTLIRKPDGSEPAMGAAAAAEFLSESEAARQGRLHAAFERGRSQ